MGWSDLVKKGHESLCKERLLRERSVVGRRTCYMEGGNERLFICWSRDTKFHVSCTPHAHLNPLIFLCEHASRDFSLRFL